MILLTNEGSKFELDCVEFKNSYILGITVINFKLCLINFVYMFFETPSGSESFDFKPPTPRGSLTGVLLGLVSGLSRSTEPNLHLISHPFHYSCS